MTQIPEKHSSPSQLHQHITEAIEKYFSNLDGEQPSNIYKMVIQEVEIPLFKTVLKYVNGNQRKAAIMLGLNRGTLRKKILEYRLDKKNI